MALIRDERDGMVESTREAATVLSNTIARCAVHGGLLDAMELFVSADELQARLGVHPSKKKALRMLLQCLADRGRLEEREVSGHVVYRRRTVVDQGDGNDLGRSKYEKVLRPFGDRAANYNWIQNAGSLLGDNLGFLRSGPGDKVPFGRKLLSEPGLDWKFLLTEPVYELGRLRAVRDLVQCGRRFLDLACGPGFGIQRLAEYSDGGCEVVAVDRSSEMLEEARRIIFPGAEVSFILRDLNTGLPPLPQGSFDGILFNGAFHFIENKKSLLDEMFRVLRPGGGLSLAHNFSRSGLDDESTWDFYFTLLKEELYPVSFSELQSLVSDAGFVEASQYHRGSFTYLMVRKPERPSA